MKGYLKLFKSGKWLSWLKSNQKMVSVHFMLAWIMYDEYIIMYCLLTFICENLRCINNDVWIYTRSIDLGARCLMLEDPDYVHHGRKRSQSSPSFNLVLRKHSWLEAFQQCGVNILKAELASMCNWYVNVCGYNYSQYLYNMLLISCL